MGILFLLAFGGKLVHRNFPYGDLSWQVCPKEVIFNVLSCNIWHINSEHILHKAKTVNYSVYTIIEQCVEKGGSIYC